jgi:predicted kinase
VKHNFIMMLGHPGSGKSYFTRQLAPKLQAVRLNADHMRTLMFQNPKEVTNRTNNPMVFGAMDYAAGEILRAGHTVISDMQYNARSRRRIGEAFATEFGALPIIIWVQTPMEIALKRGQERDETQDQRKKTEEAMRASLEKFMKALEPPEQDELCIIIDGTVPFAEQYLSYRQQAARIQTQSVSP